MKMSIDYDSFMSKLMQEIAILEEKQNDQTRKAATVTQKGAGSN